MVVNDNAYELDERGALESIASRLAPTVSRDCVKNLFLSGAGRCQWQVEANPGALLAVLDHQRPAVRTDH